MPDVQTGGQQVTIQATNCRRSAPSASTSTRLDAPPEISTSKAVPRGYSRHKIDHGLPGIQAGPIGDRVAAGNYAQVVSGRQGRLATVSAGYDQPAHELSGQGRHGPTHHAIGGLADRHHLYRARDRVPGEGTGDTDLAGHLLQAGIKQLSE